MFPHVQPFAAIGILLTDVVLGPPTYLPHSSIEVVEHHPVIPSCMSQSSLLPGVGITSPVMSCVSGLPLRPMKERSVEDISNPSELQAVSSYNPL